MSHPKHIILGVSGGIAAYKSAELVRRLKEQGAHVRVVMTDSAQRFVTPTTFQALSGHPVRTSLWDEAAEAAMGHIELARWADHILIAPASADLLARMAQGMANDLLTTLCLASPAPVSVAPAMNQHMYAHPATQSNINLLRARGVRVLGPAAGSQACGDEGLGRMMEAHEIVDALLTPHSTALQAVRVVVSAGPTREPIDPVRFITNRSSGKMGYAVAAAAAAAGAEVVLVSGPVHLKTPAGVHRIDVETATQMHAVVLNEIERADIYIATAAVADYQPQACCEQKIKKSADAFHLPLKPAPDILKSIQALPQRPFTVGFAAETERVEQHAKAKLVHKSLDMIAANQVSSTQGFDCDHNALTVYWEQGEQRLELKSKTELAGELIQLIAQRFNAKRHAS